MRLKRDGVKCPIPNYTYGDSSMKLDIASKRDLARLLGTIGLDLPNLSRGLYHSHVSSLH
jgi:hypothetical protein